MIRILIFVILLIVFVISPLPLKIVFMVANFFINDPIPVIDEAFMTASVINRIFGLGNILEFITSNPKVFILILIGVVTAIILCLKFFVFA